MYRAVFNHITYDNCIGVNQIEYIKLLADLDCTFGLGNFRAKWEGTGKDKVLVAYVYNEYDASILRLKYGK